MLCQHHAGRHQTDTNPHPACFNADDKERGTYYQCRVDTFKAFQQLRKEGKARAIGVSNFEVRELEQVFNATGEYPAVNQVVRPGLALTDSRVDRVSPNVSHV